MLDITIQQKEIRKILRQAKNLSKIYRNGEEAIHALNIQRKSIKSTTIGFNVFFLRCFTCLNCHCLNHRKYHGSSFIRRGTRIKGFHDHHDRFDFVIFTECVFELVKINDFSNRGIWIYWFKYY